MDDRWIAVYSERKEGDWAHLGKRQIGQLAAHLADVHAARLAGRIQVNVAGVETARRLSWANTAQHLLAALT